jgi:hypothetical protein
MTQTYRKKGEIIAKYLFIENRNITNGIFK